MSVPMHFRTPTTCAVPTASAQDASSWDASRDPDFFRLVAHLFRPSTTLAMTVLLASYDEEEASVGEEALRAGSPVLQRGTGS
jgi:hypothetical protein